MSHPRACSSELMAADSTPSPTTLTPSWCARSIVVRDDRAEAPAADDRAHDRAVQLELVDRPAAEALQGGEAGAEVIERELDSGLRQLREEPGADGARPRFLAHLERDHPAGHLLLVQEPGDGGGEVRVGHAPGPDVDRDGNQPPGGGPGPVLDERLPEHFQAELRHQPELLGQRDERGRLQGPELRMLPPGKQLGRHQLPGRQLNLGLEVPDQLPFLQRAGELGAQPCRYVVGFGGHASLCSPRRNQHPSHHTM